MGLVKIDMDSVVHLIWTSSISIISTKYIQNRKWME